MKTKRTLVAFALCCALVPGMATAAPVLDPSIVIVIESPGDDISGIGLVQGFALSKQGSIDYVTWAVDGADKGTLPYGGSRGDVEAAYPGYADSASPGFAAAWNYNHFWHGEHEIVVKAYDDKGGYNEVSKTFRTHRFGDGADKFLRASDLELPVIPIRGLQLHPANPKGNRYDVDLVWSKASQQFVIQSIDVVCGGCPKIAYTPPTLDSVAGRGGGRVEVIWSGGSAVMAYEIERRAAWAVGEPGPWETVGIASSLETYFSDYPPAPSGPLLAAADAWEYRIRGLGPSAKSDYSASKTVLMLGL